MINKYFLAKMNIPAYLKKFLYMKSESEHGELPAGYTQVEYIQGTGTQYINTDYNYSVNTKIKGRFEPTTTVSGGATLFGTYGPGSSRAQVLLRSGNIKGLQLWSGITNTNTESSSLYEINVPFNIETEWTNTTATLKFNDNAVLSMSNQFSGTSTFKIFSANGTTQFFTGRIYYLEIYNNGILVRNFIPCINSSNIAGMYDTVNDVFYSNAGSGTFNVGPVVN